MTDRLYDKKRVLALYDQSYDIFAGKVLALYVTLNLLSISIRLMLPSTSNILTMACGMIIWAVILLHPSNCRKLIYSWLSLSLLCLLIFGIGWFVGNPPYEDYFGRAFWFFIFGIPLYCVSSKISDTDVIVSLLSRTIPISVICIIIIVFLLNSNRVDGFDYSMSLGYALLIPLFCAIVHVVEKKSLLSLLALFLQSFVIVVYGSRGQILSIALFIFSYLCVTAKISTKKKTIAFTLLIMASFVMIVGFKTIISSIITLFDSLGLHSRTLGYLLERTTYTGREFVWEAAVKRIMERPLLGWTLGVDTSVAGFYPHQIYLEFILHFGIPLGLMLSIIITVVSLYNVGFSKLEDSLLLMFFCYGFIPLLLSSEYLVWPSFWIFMGLCFHLKHNLKRKATVEA